MYFGISSISIYTLSDLGDLSNLIGSLSRTIQQYSPPSEWIMCELGFSHFLRERSFKSRQNPKVDFFSGKKRLRRIQNGVFPFPTAEFLLDGLFTTPVYPRRRGLFVNSASPNDKNLAQKSKFIYDKQK